MSGSMKFKKEYQILLSILLVCYLTFAVLQLKCTQKSSSQLPEKPKVRHADHIDNSVRGVVIIGWDYQPEEDTEGRLSRDVVKYVLMVPHKLRSRSKTLGVASLAVEDLQELRKLKEFLDTHGEYDGATGTSTQMQAEEFAKAKTLLEQSSCRFLVKNWTIIIRNFGPIYHDDSKGLGWYQDCNIAETAFVLRKKVFLSLRWRAEAGSMSHLDFFVRSTGTLKIAKLSLCYLSNKFTYSDRGFLEGSRDFIDYSTLGQLHNILRIVRPDKIEWTKCADNKQFCPEKPLMSRPNTLAAADGFPICCDVIMDDILAATVDAMNQIGMDYRIVYGTLLGAVRSQAFIPYSDDVDVAIHKADNDRYDSFLLMQQILGPKYFVAWKTNPPVSRVYPHYAPTIAVNTRRHFKGDESLAGSSSLFDSKILREMEKLLPVKNTLLEQRYVDLYPSPEGWFGKSTKITINNRHYLGISDNIDNFLKSWYGDDYMKMRPKLHSKTYLAS